MTSHRQDMHLQTTLPNETENVSKLKLAFGAASLFLFLVGIKRTFEPEAESAIGASRSPGDSAGRGEATGGANQGAPSDT